MKDIKRHVGVALGAACAVLLDGLAVECLASSGLAVCVGSGSGQVERFKEGAYVGWEVGRPMLQGSSFSRLSRLPHPPLPSVSLLLRAALFLEGHAAAVIDAGSLQSFPQLLQTLATALQSGSFSSSFRRHQRCSHI